MSRWLFRVVVNRIHASNGPSFDTNFAAIRAGFDDKRFILFLDADNAAGNTSDCCNLITDLSALTHGLFLFPFLGLRTNHDKIQGILR